jgi:hypothetical protein
MKNTLHTPGPWKHDSTWGIIKHGKTEICALHSGNLANANLIASAPDLLSALESLAVWNDGEPCFCHVHGESERARYTPHDSYCDKAREALRKAKGEA